MDADPLAICRAFRAADDRRARREVAVTAVGLIASWAAAAALVRVDRAAALAVDVVVALFLVRLFVLQHDAGHGALFSTRAQNDRFGAIACVPLLVPYLEWRKSHAIHHRISSQLDHRIFPDIYTVTLDEYLSFPLWKKLAYRLFRNPVVLFGIVPIYFFFISCRIKGSMCPTLPTGAHRVNLHATTMAALALFGGLSFLLGADRVLFVFLPSQVMAGSFGFWLFYVQHQAEDTWWARDGTWSYVDAALKGSSFLRLPPWLAWSTAWIGYHHVHHLDPRVPCYRLVDADAALRAAGCYGHPGLSFVDGLRTVRLALWDEASAKMVPFSAAATVRTQATAT